MKKNVKNLFGGLIVTITFVMGITGCGNNKDENKQLSLVSLDINPSIELFVNNDGIIQNVNGINDEAKNILKDLDLSNDSLEEGISEIIEETIEKGYIKNIEENDILVSIDGTSVDQTLILREKTKTAIDETLKENSLKANLVTQEIEVTDDIINKAMEKNISVGKLYAIEQINSKSNGQIQDYEKTPVKDIVNVGKQINVFDDDNDDNDDINDDRDDINDDRDDINDDKDDINDDRDDINDDKDDDIAKPVVQQPKPTSSKPVQQKPVVNNNGDDDNDDNDDDSNDNDDNDDDNDD
nr:hypothetical protein [uncultured Tyzzerella sp.]